jgi:uncharacterized RDD family membrane protein YckC
MPSVPSSVPAAPPPPAWDARPGDAAVGRPGGFWIRFVAALIDGVILAVIFGVAAAILVVLLGLGIEDPTNLTDAEMIAASGLIILLAIVLIVCGWLYEAILTSSVRGATWGKQALGLRVLRADGVRLSFGRATARYFCKTLITPLVPLAIGYLLAAFTRRKQALHDFMADTVVIHTS